MMTPFGPMTRLDVAGLWRSTGIGSDERSDAVRGHEMGCARPLER